MTWPFPHWPVFDPRPLSQPEPVCGFHGGGGRNGGAPTTAAYCLYPALQGSRLRLRSPERVVDELEALRDTYQIKLVHFTDPVVNQPAEHLRSICREVLRRGLDIGWTGFFREDTVTR